MLLTTLSKESYQYGPILVIAQVISIQLHLKKLYQGFIHNFLALMREFQILFVVLFQGALHLID